MMPRIQVLVARFAPQMDLMDKASTQLIKRLLRQMDGVLKRFPHVLRSH